MQLAFNPELAEKLIRMSKEKPLLPEVFVPWDIPESTAPYFLPESLNSLHGMPEYEALTDFQKRELGRHEIVQVMYSYAWSEGMFCLFMNRYILNLAPDQIEYRFLIRELLEEFRHQDMFATAVALLDGKPILPGFWHNFIGKLTVKYMPDDVVFMSGVSVEMVTDIYGNRIRKDPNAYEVMRKVAELHHIEEARHITFGEMLLSKYTRNAGFIRRSWYSLIVMWNIYFMRTLYVQPEIYERIGLENSKQLYRRARRHFKEKFGKECLGEAIAFVEKWDGFNWFTRPLWRYVLAANV